MKQANRRSLMSMAWGAVVVVMAHLCIAGVAGAKESPAVGHGNFPHKPVTIVVPFSSGGSPDKLARILGQELAARWHVPVIIENKPGAGGNIAAAYVARSAPDGYTLLMGTDGPLAINQSIYASLPFDPVRAFAPVGLVASVDFVLVAANSMPAGNVQEFFAYVRDKDPALAYGSAGVGSQHHLGMEAFRVAAALELRHIPYRGVAPALADVVGDHIPTMFAAIPSAAPLIRAGKIKGLAVTGQRRSSLIPDVPTMQEAGLAGFMLSAWFGLVAPADTLPAVIDHINMDLNKALSEPNVQAALAADGFIVTSASPTVFAEFIRTEQVRWAKVAKQANVAVQIQ